MTIINYGRTTHPHETGEFLYLEVLLQLNWFSADPGVKQEAVRAGRGSTVDYSGWGLDASLFGCTVT